MSENNYDSIRKSNRERFPEFAKIMDEIPGAKMLCVETADGCIGKKPDELLVSFEFAAWVDNWYELTNERKQSPARRNAAKSGAGKATEE